MEAKTRAQQRAEERKLFKERKLVKEIGSTFFDVYLTRLATLRRISE